MMALTRPAFSRVTMPFFLYQTPSRVRQTSSASILPPVVRIITGLPPPLVLPLVETGPRFVVVCDVATRVGDGCGEGAGDGEGETDGDVDGVGSSGAVGVGATGMAVEACSSLASLMNTR